MKRFTVVFDRNKTGWWVAQVKEVPAAISQGRSLAEARRRIRQALALTLNSDQVARRAMLIEDVHLPRMAHRALLTLSASRARLALEKERFVQATDTAISELLRGMRLSVRDTAELLGLSHQRVQQLKVASPSGGSRTV